MTWGPSATAETPHFTLLSKSCHWRLLAESVKIYFCKRSFWLSWREDILEKHKYHQGDPRRGQCSSSDRRWVRGLSPNSGVGDGLDDDGENHGVILKFLLWQGTDICAILLRRGQLGRNRLGKRGIQTKCCVLNCFPWDILIRMSPRMLVMWGCNSQQGGPWQSSQCTSYPYWYGIQSQETR